MQTSNQAQRGRTPAHSHTAWGRARAAEAALGQRPTKDQVDEEALMYLAALGPAKGQGQELTFSPPHLH